MDTLYFTWIDKPVDIERDLQLPQFALRGYVQHDCSQNYTGGMLYHHSSWHLYDTCFQALSQGAWE